MGPHHNNHLIIFSTALPLITADGVWVTHLTSETDDNSKYDLMTESFGQLVALGFDVTVFTPAPYQRRRLRRPSMEFSSRGGLRT